MITGAHVVIFSADAPADRAFLRDVVRLSSVDAGDGWLVFSLPPSELALHPADEGAHELYLLTDDVASEVETLRSRGATCSDIEQQSWGSLTRVRLPGGGDLGLYQPRHRTASHEG